MVAEGRPSPTMTAISVADTLHLEGQVNSGMNLNG
jgi:hypothetical protein